ncbi:MAG: RluA family pseudouridine synthase [Clostridia bacterium]|nr:RluA family pseudouridine synthase [Clostridia bacterium]
MNEELNLRVPLGGERVDKFIAANTGLSRAYAQTLIADGKVWVNGAAAKKNTVLRDGDEIRLVLAPREEIRAFPQDIPIEIVYEDADICVINKPQGMVVHPAPGNPSGTLVNALMFHLDALSETGGEAERPGIVHRIDKMTSGLLVVAKNDLAHESLAGQFAAHTARRSYLALVHGNVREDGGTVRASIGRHKTDRTRMAVLPDGKDAVTHFRTLERFGAVTLLQLELETGRTHQIRVHMKHIRHPILGDAVYGSADERLGFKGQALHGYRLRLIHPRTQEPMAFFAPLPEYFKKALLSFGSRLEFEKEIFCDE